MRRSGQNDPTTCLEEGFGVHSGLLVPCSPTSLADLVTAPRKSGSGGKPL